MCLRRNLKQNSNNTVIRDGNKTSSLSPHKVECSCFFYSYPYIFFIFFFSPLVLHTLILILLSSPVRLPTLPLQTNGGRICSLILWAARRRFRGSPLRGENSSLALLVRREGAGLGLFYEPGRGIAELQGVEGAKCKVSQSSRRFGETRRRSEELSGLRARRWLSAAAVR